MAGSPPQPPPARPDPPPPGLCAWRLFSTSQIYTFGHKPLKKKKSTTVPKNLRKHHPSPPPHPQQTHFVPSLLILHRSVIKNSFSCQERHCFTLPSPHLIACIFMTHLRRTHDATRCQANDKAEKSPVCSSEIAAVLF